MKVLGGILSYNTITIYRLEGDTLANYSEANIQFVQP